eukprot:2449946-Rhodomonas_salina.2
MVFSGSASILRPRLPGRKSHQMKQFRYTFELRTFLSRCLPGKENRPGATGRLGHGRASWREERGGHGGRKGLGHGHERKGDHEAKHYAGGVNPREESEYPFWGVFFVLGRHM